MIPERHMKQAKRRNDYMIHELKTFKSFFDDLQTERKTFEVRKNDRNFQAGDYLALNEYVPNDNGGYTGRSMLFRITYILDDKQYCKENYVILNITPCVIRDRYDYFKPDEQIHIQGVPIYCNEPC